MGTGKTVISSMKRIPGIILVPVLLLTACTTAPYTQRSQLMLISLGEENQLGAQAFQQILSKEKVSHDPVLQAVVDRIGSRVANAARRPDFQWQFVVVDNPKTANAFALPGGKVAVYTGMFPVAKTEGGLAAVMAHEVAHVLARHGGERLSHGLLAQMGAVAVQAGMAGRDPGVVQGVMTAYGLGANVGVLLPYGRLQESEADRIGLVLMAQAGYDPREAVQLWQRMGEQDRQAPPEFLSTHPSPRTRIQDLQGLMPNALTYYRPSPDQIAESTRLLPGLSIR
ncbi:MAG: Peptidase family M48 [candidate division NC10 bacterium CSP1-5]|nr:MAG: Peptidase family M48 [candidate division NC10 bacterium CSP1-5]